MTMVAATDTIRIPGDMVLIPYKEYEILIKAKENDDYRKKIEASIAQSESGKVITKSIDDLEAMLNE